MSGPGSWLGIDVGGTAIKWEHLDDAGRRLAAGRVATPTSGEVAVVDAIGEIARSRMAGGSVSGLGVAVPGHLTPARDAVTLLPNVAGRWLGFPFQAYLAEGTGLAPVLLNDARAFAVAELELGAARDVEDAVFATIGTGVGGAVATRGAVVTSRRDTFGELGHTVAVPDGRLCSCGGRGCVEAYAGGSAVLAQAERLGLPVTRGSDALTTLAAEARTSQLAAGVLDEAYDAFATGVSNACAYAGARVVVVGGAVAAELPGYLRQCRSRLEGRQGLLGTVDVRSASLGARAGALGAALAARATHDHDTERLVLL